MRVVRFRSVYVRRSHNTEADTKEQVHFLGNIEPYRRGEIRGTEAYGSCTESKSYECEHDV